VTYDLKPDGSKTIIHKYEGTFYRSSSGAEMNTMGTMADFSDSAGNSYRINHEKKLAVLQAQNDRPLYQAIKETPLSSIEGYDMVNGARCGYRKLYVNGTPGGREYISLQYVIYVRVEFMEPNSTHQIVREMYDIEVAEPDPSLVKIPKGYTLAKE
jgi:hypothetical protein